MNKVKLTTSQITNDLYSGMSWYEKDNTGNGSIQNKYNMKDFQVAIIMQHEKFQNLTEFILEDDLSEENNSSVNTTVDSCKQSNATTPKRNPVLEEEVTEEEFNQEQTEKTIKNAQAFDNL